MSASSEHYLTPVNYTMLLKRYEAFKKQTISVNIKLYFFKSQSFNLGGRLAQW